MMHKRHKQDRSFPKLVLPIALTTIVACVVAMPPPGNYTHSLTKLMHLVHIDFTTVDQLGTLTKSANMSSSILDIADEYLEDFANCTNSETRSEAKYAEQVITNPLSRFKLIARIVRFFKALQSEQVDEIPGLAVNQLKEEYEKDVGGRRKALPLQGDMFQAADAILQIHFTYNLKAKDLAGGIIKGKDTGVRLVALNCLFVGFVAKFNRKNTLAVDWLTTAIRLAQTDGTVSVSTAQAMLMDTIKQHNWERENRDFSHYHLFTKPIKPGESPSTQHKISKAKDVLEEKYAGKGRNPSHWPMNMWSLCSKGKYRNPLEGSSHLFCWLESKAHEVLTLGPLKMEFLSRNPDIVQVLNAFSHTNEQLLAEAELGNETKRWINKRVEAMTGLSCANSTLLLSNHLPGRVAEFQVDSVRNGSDTGDRIASVVIYLNDVEGGGATVFPAALATAVPNKGSAIFWFSVLSDGTPDFSTVHADCPIALGQKLVAYKRIRFYDDQSFSKCLLGPNEKFQVLVNGKAFSVPPAFRHPLITREEFTNPIPLSGSDEGALAKNTKPVLVLSKYAYSPARSLKSLVRLDCEIYRNITRIFATVNGHAADERMGALLSYIEDFNEPAYNSVLFASNVTDNFVVKLAGNPLAVYRTLRRFENYIKKWTTDDLKQQVRGQPFARIQDYLAKVYKPKDGPSYRDLEASIVGILRIQHVLDFESDQIARGIVAGIDSGIRLTAVHCVQFGRQAIIHGFYYQAVEWMELAVAKIIAEEDFTVELQETRVELQIAKEAHDSYVRRTKGQHRSTFSREIARLNDTKSLQRNRRLQYDKFKFHNSKDHAEINFMAICQGKAHQTAEEKRKLFCWYEKGVDPYWKIGPLKAEILSMHPKPEIVQYHDVLAPETLAFLSDQANSKEHKFISSNSIVEANPASRLGATYWHPLNSSEKSERIKKLVMKATGLTVVAKHLPTVLQIASYTPGSHFSVHPDTWDYDVALGTARIATFMFYLSHVEKGGETGFAQAGIRVTPTKGSAIFWYNMLSSGLSDNLTFHGGCPVIFGEKLIGTQWMHYADQEHLQCHPDRDKRIEILVNGNSKYGVNNNNNNNFAPTPNVSMQFSSGI